MLIGYARVSKADGSQTTDLQRDALLAAGVDPEQIYEDQASGKQDDRPQLAVCLKALRSGDTLIVWKLDRLGRDLRHLVNVVHDLTDRGVGLKVLTGQGAAIDTTTASGKLVFGIFAALAEFERELISERTKAGLASARARGRKGGATLQNDPSQSPTGPSLDGSARYQRGRTVCRTWRYPPNFVPPCLANRGTALRWQKSSRHRPMRPFTEASPVTSCVEKF